jgi:hypothetical protein
MDVKDLLNRFLRWIRSPKKTVTIDRTVAGIRLIQLQRHTPRSLSVWRAYCPNFNLEFSLETLGHIAGVEPVRKKHRFATHIIHVVRTSNKGTRSYREVLMSEEVVLEPAFSVGYVNPIAIFDETVKLLIKTHPNGQPKYNPEEIDWVESFTIACQKAFRSDSHVAFPGRSR